MKNIVTKLSAAVIGAALFAPAYAADAPAATSVYIQSHNAQQTVAAKNFPSQNNRSFPLQSWDVTTADGAAFLALCIEPGQAMPTGTQSYVATNNFYFADTATGASRQGSIERLYGLYYDKITGTDEASKDLSLSFQLALWELYNDDATFATTTSGKLAVNNNLTYSSSTGQWRGNGVGDHVGADVIVTNAYDMLAAAQDTSLKYTQTYTFTRYTGTGQDFVIAKADTVSPVPEPSTYAMLGLGLAVVGFTARRRAKQ
jgi:hypothetical protein